MEKYISFFFKSTSSSQLFSIKTWHLAVKMVKKYFFSRLRHFKFTVAGTYWNWKCPRLAFQKIFFLFLVWGERRKSKLLRLEVKKIFEHNRCVFFLFFSAMRIGNHHDLRREKIELLNKFCRNFWFSIIQKLCLN